MTIPDHIWKLGESRQAARSEKNYARADEIRDELLSLGWEIIDVSGQFELRPKVRYSEIQSISALKPLFAGSRISICLIVTGFPKDAANSIASIRKFSSAPILTLVFGAVDELENVIDDQTVVIRVLEDCGWGAAANAALQKISSPFVVIMDPSTTLEGDAIAPILEVLEIGEFSAVGWRGGLVNVEDEWRSVDDRGAGEVDVLFSYFLAVNRESAVEVGGFNSRAVYYRNADIEFSLRLRQTGGRLLQMDLPLTQGRHHGYHDVDPEYRDVQSKKNYDRILERFRGKNAILSERR
ncbi:MAG: hypothetical protein WDO06_09045 [Actinomycetota bacterium]